MGKTAEHLRRMLIFGVVFVKTQNLWKTTTGCGEHVSALALGIPGVADPGHSCRTGTRLYQARGWAY